MFQADDIIRATWFTRSIQCVWVMVTVVEGRRARVGYVRSSTMIPRTPLYINWKNGKRAFKRSTSRPSERRPLYFRSMPKGLAWSRQTAPGVRALRFRPGWISYMERVESRCSISREGGPHFLPRYDLPGLGDLFGPARMCP